MEAVLWRTQPAVVQVTTYSCIVLYSVVFVVLYRIVMYFWCIIQQLTMPVGAEAAGYGGSALAYTTGRGAGYDVGDADLFETTTSRQELLETRRTNRVSLGRKSHTINCPLFYRLY